MKNYEYEVIYCIVNSGFSELVMDTAKAHGARGGTILRARGTANTDAEKLFNITIQSEKEIVMIIVKSDIKDDILHALYQTTGLNTPGHGIAFSMPVDKVVGLSDGALPEKKEEKQEETGK